MKKSICLAGLFAVIHASLTLDNSEEDNGILSPISSPSLIQLQERAREIQRIPVPALAVGKNHVFIDSLDFLTDGFVEAEMPSEIKLDGKSIGHKDWIKKAAAEAGQLLFAREGRSVILKDDQPMQAYVAFGRLMAYGLIHEQSFGIPFPDTFFDELLDSNYELSPTATEQMKAIQKGFSHLYDIDSLSHLWGANFSQLFTE